MGASVDAKCRAGWTQHVLRCARARSPAAAKELVARIGEPQFALIEAAPTMHWIPFALHMSVLRACHASFGRRGFRDFSRAMVAASLANPMLFAKQAALVSQWIDGAPLAIFKVLPVAIQQIFRDAGWLEVQTDARTGHVVYDGLPPSHATADTWSLIWLGTLEALAEYALKARGLVAEIVETRVDTERGRFEWHAEVRKASLPFGDRASGGNTQRP